MSGLEKNTPWSSCELKEYLVKLGVTCVKNQYNISLPSGTQSID